MTTTRLGATIAVLNRLEAEGTIGRYAMAGAMAAFRHVSMTFTEDLDLLVAIPTAGSSGLLAVAPIFARLSALGYSEFSHEGVLVEGWPVQFLPVASDLDAEALEQAEPVEIPGPREGEQVATRSLRSEHLIAKAVSVGRPKDLVRIQQFLDEEAVDLAALRAVLERHGLLGRWGEFCRRMAIGDPLTSKT